MICLAMATQSEFLRRHFYFSSSSFSFIFNSCFVYTFFFIHLYTVCWRCAEYKFLLSPVREFVSTKNTMLFYFIYALCCWLFHFIQSHWSWSHIRLNFHILLRPFHLLHSNFETVALGLLHAMPKCFMSMCNTH